ncbi:MAG TPA: thioredoxin [Afifellaceae bacterium]|nr:thioredoxin [Afifellaceae bacterium]
MSAEMIIGQGEGAAAGDLVRETTTQGFRQDVLDASRQVPVLVDFWAPWCGPCRQLTPILEKVVRQSGGKVRLVKLNIDEHPEIPGQLGIQSIPAVIAFRNGQPLDGFLGAVPESQVVAFIRRLTGATGPSRAEEALEAAAAALAQKDYAGAAGLYGALLQAEPDNAAALAGLVRCQVALGNLDQARNLLASLPAEKAEEGEVAGARAALELAEQAAALGAPADLKARLDADPGDHKARFDLALVLNSRGDRAGAADQLIEIVRRDREWNDGAARQQLVQFFEAWGAKDPATLRGRQRLSAVLFS